MTRIKIRPQSDPLDTIRQARSVLGARKIIVFRVAGDGYGSLLMYVGQSDLREAVSELRRAGLDADTW